MYAGALYLLLLAAADPPGVVERVVKAGGVAGHEGGDPARPVDFLLWVETATDADLGGLCELRHLHTLMLIDCDHVTDGCLDTLATLTQLRYLDLRGSGTTEAGAARLRRALPNCNVVR